MCVYINIIVYPEWCQLRDLELPQFVKVARENIESTKSPLHELESLHTQVLCTHINYKRLTVL